MLRDNNRKDKEAYSRSVEDVEVVEYANSDDMQLELLGYKSQFKRDFSFLGLYSLVSSELAVLPGVAGTIWYVSLARVHATRHSILTRFRQVHDGILVSLPHVLALRPIERTLSGLVGMTWGWLVGAVMGQVSKISRSHLYAGHADSPRLLAMQSPSPATRVLPR